MCVKIQKKIVEARIIARARTCALRSNPPVDPPKIGLGVFGLSLGAVQTAGAAADAFSSARTTRAAPREEDARRVVARGVTRTWEEVAERLNMFDASRCADRATAGVGKKRSADRPCVREIKSVRIMCVFNCM